MKKNYILFKCSCCSFTSKKVSQRSLPVQWTRTSLATCQTAILWTFFVKAQPLTRRLISKIWFSSGGIFCIGPESFKQLRYKIRKETFLYSIINVGSATFLLLELCWPFLQRTGTIWIIVSKDNPRSFFIKFYQHLLSLLVRDVSKFVIFSLANIFLQWNRNISAPYVKDYLRCQLSLTLLSRLGKDAV